MVNLNRIIEHAEFEYKEAEEIAERWFHCKKLLESGDPRIAEAPEELKDKFKDDFGDRLTERFKRVGPFLKHVLDNKSKFQWFDLGDYSDFSTIMSEKELRTIHGDENIPYAFTAISIAFGKEIVKDLTFLCVEKPSGFDAVAYLKSTEHPCKFRAWNSVVEFRKVEHEGILMWQVSDYDFSDMRADPSLFTKVKAGYQLATTCILVLIKILRCKNVYIDREEFPKKLNKAKAKKGHLKGFDRHILKIKDDPKVVMKGHLGGTHASPRLHFRRGHIRRYKSGVTIWIREMMVGKPKLGQVEKDYQVNQ